MNKFLNFNNCKNYIFAIVTFFTLTFSLIFISSLIFAYTNLNDKYIDLTLYIILGIASFISSFILCKKVKKRGLVNGIGINIFCILILFIISCILNNNICINTTLGFYTLISVISGMLGGILGVNV